MTDRHGLLGTVSVGLDVVNLPAAQPLPWV
jgi:hypothetical protein